MPVVEVRKYGVWLLAKNVSYQWLASIAGASMGSWHYLDR